MTDTTAITTTTTTTRCHTCDAAFPYEPILCFGRDLAAHLSKECPACLAEAERNRRLEKEEERMQHACSPCSPAAPSAAAPASAGPPPCG